MTATANPPTAATGVDPTVSAILARIKETPKPRVTRAAVAFSGGLDSSLGAKMLTEVYGASEIVPITVDIGQGDEELQMAFSQAQLLGLTPILIDAREEFATAWLTQAIQATVAEVGTVVQRAHYFGVSKTLQPITDPKDFKGLKIVTSPEPNTNYSVAKRLLEKAGLKVGVDATIVPVNPGTEIAAMLAGQADIAIAYQPSVAAAEAQGAKVVFDFSS